MTGPIGGGSLDLTPAEKKIIESLLSRYLRGTEVWAFGSRTNGNATTTSDLDLVAFIDREETDLMESIREAFEASDLGFRVDLLSWREVPETFRSEIRRQHVVLMHPTTAPGPDWRTLRLGDFAPLNYGKALRGPDRVEDGPVPVFGSNGPVGSHDEALTAGATVIVGRKGTAGSVHYSPEPCWPIDTTYWHEDPDPDLCRFKYYLLGALRLDEMNSDSAVPGLSRRVAHALMVSVPPAERQRTVARFLGALDDHIDLNARTARKLDEMAQAIFKDWFVDFGPTHAKFNARSKYLPDGLWSSFPGSFTDSDLGRIPRGWVVRSLGDLCGAAQYGYTASGTTEPIGPKFVRITDINKRPWIDWQAVPHCPANADVVAKYGVCRGDLLVARMADPGHAVLVEEDADAVFASYLIRFRPKVPAMGRFLQYWMRSNAYWDLVRATRAGTTRMSLSARALARFRLVVPTQSLVARFETFADALRNRVVQSGRQTVTLAAARDALSRWLLSGHNQ